MRRIGNWKTIHYLSPDEIFDLLKEKNLAIIKTKLKIRQSCNYGCFFNGEKSQEISPGTIKQLVPKLIKKTRLDNQSSVKLVKGISGNIGVVKGRVVVVRKTSDFSKVKVGNILVASMTSTDYIMLMKKAAAFVTDEGGLTSHPAIVAREMNKPCIVGTKIATQVFKDGDKVEVDANKGVVRKL